MHCCVEVLGSLVSSHICVEGLYSGEKNTNFVVVKRIVSLITRGLDVIGVFHVGKHLDPSLCVCLIKHTDHLGNILLYSPLASTILVLEPSLS